MKIAIITQVPSDYFVNHQCQTREEALNQIISDEDVPVILSRATVERIRGEFGSDAVNNDSFTTGGDGYIQLVIVYDDVDNDDVLSHLDTNHHTNRSVANSIVCDEEGARFSNVSSSRIVGFLMARPEAESVASEANSEEQQTENSISEVPNAPDVPTASQELSSETPTPRDSGEIMNNANFRRAPSHNTPTITVGEAINRLRAFDENAKIYEQYYREGSLVEYRMPQFAVCTETVTNIDDPQETFGPNHIVIF